MMDFLIDLVGEVDDVAGVEPVVDAEGVLIRINRRGSRAEGREVQLAEVDPREIGETVPADVLDLGQSNGLRLL